MRKIQTALLLLPFIPRVAYLPFLRPSPGDAPPVALLSALVRCFSTYSVSAATTVTISLTALNDFVVTPAGTVPDQTLVITSDEAAEFGFVATASPSWITVKPATGTAPLTAKVSVDPTGKAPGTYQGK